MRAAIILLVSTVVTVQAVRMLVIRGIEHICNALSLSSKAKGQILGYATSTPELVVVVASALSGVFEAGFWNIASSNIINCVLLASAVLAYRQHKELFRVGFLDEIAFGLVSVAVPIVLFRLDIPITAGVAGSLFAFFIVYKVLDRIFNPKPASPDSADGRPPGRLGFGLFLLAAGLLVVIVAGRFLGGSAATLVRQAGTPVWLVGWILGVITSLPEMTSFFEIYRLSRERGTLRLTHDTQECLDALVASNMSNLGIILPIGALVFLLVSR
jgi:Ca2+/Na+ antiporter